MAGRAVVAASMLLLVAGAAVGPTAFASRTGSATFTDPSGDAQGAPDIRAVTVGDEAGMVAITVAAVDLHVNTRINVYLNTDRAGNFDYWLHYQKGATAWLWNVSKWTGSAWQRLPLSNTMSITPGDDVCGFRVSAADLGGTTAFRFTVGTVLFDPVSKKATARDNAPDSGTWFYSLGGSTPTTTQAATTTTTAATTAATTTSAASVRPRIGAPILVPAAPRAGKPLTVAFPVTRSDTAAPLKTGKMTCDPSVGGKPIRHVESFRNGVARIAFTLPKTAKGKYLKVAVNIRAGSSSSSRVAFFRVR